VLEAEGRGWDDLVWFRIFYRERDDFPRLNEVRKPFFEARMPAGNFPATTGVVTGLGEDGLTIELEMMLGAGKVLRDSPWVWKTIRGGLGKPPAAHGVEWGGLLWISGQVGYDEEANLVDPTALGQLPQALRNLWAIIKDAGCRREDVAQFTFHLVASAFDEYEAVREEFEAMLAEVYGERPPLVSFVGVEELFMPGVLVEIEGYVATDAAARTVATPAVGGGEARAELGIRARSAPAARVGELAFATGVGIGDSVGRCFTAALDELEAALATVESGLAKIHRATLWFAPRDSYDEVLSLLDAAIGTRLPADLSGKVLVTPISAAPEVEASVRFEVMAG
jgi:enamine deaminase RidA (YjgF/YER057c/UK114 family)